MKTGKSIVAASVVLICSASAAVYGLHRVAKPVTVTYSETVPEDKIRKGPRYWRDLREGETQCGFAILSKERNLFINPDREMEGCFVSRLLRLGYANVKVTKQNGAYVAQILGSVLEMQNSPSSSYQYGGYIRLKVRQ